MTPKITGVLLLSALSQMTYAVDTVDILPELNIQKNKISVSGVSSGGYMAQQLHVAYSDVFSAAGIIAGGPFYCAENNIGLALTRCMKPDDVNKPNVAGLIEITRYFDAMGDIADTENMLNDRVWIYSSIDDSVVHQPVSDALFAYYAAFVPAKQVKYVNNRGGEHSMPTNDFGFPCDYLGASSNPDDYFINNCDFDAAGELLAHANKTIKRPKTDVLSGRMVKFDQENFIAQPETHGMAKHGYAYIPEKCDVNEKGKSRKCKLHLAFHGCLQSADRIGRTFVDNAGYNDWADRNNIVVVYPQATQSLDQGNGNGCWDWWGYDSNNYATQYGNQMNAVMSMVNRLSGQSTANQLSSPILSVESETAGHITLSWTTVDGAIGYEVYESTGANGPFYQVSADLVENNSLSLVTEPGQQSHYIVLAVSAEGEEGLPSNDVAIAVPRIL